MNKIYIDLLLREMRKAFKDYGLTIVITLGLYVLLINFNSDFQLSSSVPAPSGTSMPTGLLITVYLTAAFVSGLLASIFASAKNRHAGYWMIFCFLIPPMIVLLFLLPKGRYLHHAHRDPFHDGE